MGLVIVSVDPHPAFLCSKMTSSGNQLDLKNGHKLSQSLLVFCYVTQHIRLSVTTDPSYFHSKAVIMYFRALQVIIIAVSSPFIPKLPLYVCVQLYHRYFTWLFFGGWATNGWDAELVLPSRQVK